VIFVATARPEVAGAHRGRWGGGGAAVWPREVSFSGHKKSLSPRDASYTSTQAGKDDEVAIFWGVSAWRNAGKPRLTIFKTSHTMRQFTKFNANTSSCPVTTHHTPRPTNPRGWLHEAHHANRTRPALRGNARQPFCPETTRSSVALLGERQRFAQRVLSDTWKAARRPQ